VPLRSLPAPLYSSNETPPTEIYTLSLHDALPISPGGERLPRGLGSAQAGRPVGDGVLEHEMRVTAAQQLAYVVAQRVVGIRSLAFRAFGKHARLVEESV